MNNSALKEMAAETAVRLRMIQVDFAAESDETQNEYVKEHLKEVLKKVPSAEKRDFLDLLKSHFPIAVDLHANEQRPPVEKTGLTDQSILNNPDYLLKMFSQYISVLGSEEKRELAKKLFPSEIDNTVIPIGTDEAIDIIQKRLNIKDKTISADHMAIQYKLLLEFITQIRELICKSWSTLAPNAKIHPKRNLPELLNQYLTEHSDGPYDEMAYGITELKRFTTAFVVAMAKAGGLFASQWLAAYSPSAILQIVKMEGGGFFKSEGERCWEKYKQLADSLTRETIENMIRKAIIECIESIVVQMEATKNRSNNK